MAGASADTTASFTDSQADTAGGGSILDGQKRHLSCLQSSPLSQGVSGPHSFWHYKEDGRLEAHSEFETLEQVYQAAEVQNTDIGFGPTLPVRSMGGVSGPKGRLPSHPYMPRRPQVASLPHRRSGVSVQVPTLWPLNSTQGVYEGGRSGGRLPEATWGEYLFVSRRLADRHGNRHLLAS